MDYFSYQLRNLSPEEHSNGLHDLHGVADEIEETSEMLGAKLQEMSEALSTFESLLGAQGCYGYRKAVTKSADYVDSLKLRFLRAEGYNGKNSAGRMIRFFNFKMECFGEDKLVQDIKLRDLEENEVEALDQGLFQVLSQRDRAGRAVLMMHGKMSAMCSSTETAMRALFYFSMATMSDEETQLQGAVYIYNGIGQRNQVHGRALAYSRCMSSLPIRCRAVHVCGDAEFLNPSRWVASPMLENWPMSRMRFHFGTALECVYKLMTFGIPQDVIPITDDGSLDLTRHRNVLRALGQREQQTRPMHVSSSAGSELKTATSSSTVTPEEMPSSSIIVPGPMDILLGRGRRPNSSPGSLRMYRFLNENIKAYESGSKFAKTVLATSIVNQMKDTGSRFLTLTPQGIVECDDLVSREKIAHAFRSLRGKRKSRCSGS